MTIPSITDEAAINAEANALRDATLALATLASNPEALNRVLRYLNERFNPRQHLDMVPRGVQLPTSNFNTAETLR